MSYSLKNDPLLNPGPKSQEALTDADRLLIIRRIDDQGRPSAAGSYAVAAGIITFYSTNTTGTPEGGAGATNFPDETGLADGVLDLSVFGSAPATWLEVTNLINAQPNWECWAEASRPDIAIADTDLLAQAVAATTAGVTDIDGHPVFGDTTVVLACAVGITNNGSTGRGSKQNNDTGTNQTLLSIANTPTGTGTLESTLYEIDDTLGTSTLIRSLGTSATTVEHTLGPEGGIHTVESRRMVVELTGASTLTAAAVRIVAQQQVLGSARAGFYDSDNG